MEKIVVAIDGYSSCGKSTVARELAKRLHYSYIDTGAMYRAVTLYFLDKHIDWADNAAVLRALGEVQISFLPNPVSGNSDIYLNGKNVEQEIRQMPVSQHVSAVSALKPVRDSMVKLQQAIGKEKGVVMDGRDIGTRVFPDAALKIFMTADPAVRVRRRFDELTQKGIIVSIDDISRNLKERDYLDTHRAESPLLQAGDAILLDNTHLTREQQLNFILEKVRSTLKNP